MLCSSRLGFFWNSLDSVHRRGSGQVPSPFTPSFLPDRVWGPEAPERREKPPRALAWRPPDGVSGLSSGGTGSEKPPTELAGPAPSARPGMEAAAGTTCVTEVGNDFKTLWNGRPLQSLSHRMADVKRGSWTIWGGNWSLLPSPSALPSSPPHLWTQGSAPAPRGYGYPWDVPSVRVSRGRHPCSLDAQSLV